MIRTVFPCQSESERILKIDYLLSKLWWQDGVVEGAENTGRENAGHKNAVHCNGTSSAYMSFSIYKVHLTNIFLSKYFKRIFIKLNKVIITSGRN